MAEIKFHPCIECIESLRYKLFLIKTKCGMVPFKIGKQYALQYLFDMYSNYPNNIINEYKNYFNIEHTIPANIIAPRPTSDKVAYINKEPFHDLHILFPTLTNINSMRGNLPYGTVSTSRQNIIDRVGSSPNEYSIINTNTFFGSPRISEEYPQLYKINKEDLDEYPQNLDIYINKKNICRLGECVFQPPKKFSGDIARIVFYFYLMYGYDFSQRPYKNPIDKNRIPYPWFANISDGVCYGFDFEKWKTFYIDHLSDYYNWAKNDPISEEEHRRNITIIQIVQVPNIFVGYKTKFIVDGVEKSFYINSNFDVIEELLFGKPHDHNKYKNIIFDIDIARCSGTDLKIEDNVFNRIKDDVKCRIKVNKENILAKTLQNSLADKITVASHQIQQHGKPKTFLYAPKTIQKQIGKGEDYPIYYYKYMKYKAKYLTRKNNIRFQNNIL